LNTSIFMHLIRNVGYSAISCLVAQTLKRR